MMGRTPYHLPEVQRLADEAARAALRQKAQPNRFAGQITKPLRKGEHRRVGFGEAVVCDPTGGEVTVHLPRIAEADLGHPITVLKASSAAPLVVLLPAAGATINGVPSLTLAESYAEVTLIPITKTLWVARGVRPETMTENPGPLWTWNGVDLSQFETPLQGVLVASHSESVVSHGGVSWIRLAASCSGGYEFEQRAVVLPIGADLPSPVRIEAEILFYSRASSTVPLVAGLVQRIDLSGVSGVPCKGYYGVASTDGGNGYVGALLTSTDETYQTRLGGQGNIIGWSVPFQLSILGHHLSLNVPTSFGAVASPLRYASGGKHGLVMSYGSTGTAGEGEIRIRNVRVWAV